MKATELRIGNFIKDRGGKIWQIDSFEYNTKVCSKEPILGFCEFSKKPILGHPLTEEISFLQPIPLTEEILLKCPKIEKTNDYGDQKYFNLIGTRYWFCLDHEDFSFGVYSKKDNQSEVIVLEYFDLGIFLHQFQNLIFALTGEELNVNL